MRISRRGDAQALGIVRPDGVAINAALQIVYILEFKWSTDREKWLLEVKEAKASEQYKGIIGALRAVAPKWEFEQMVVGNRRSTVESAFYTNLKTLDAKEGKKDKLFANHVTQVCETHDQVILSFLEGLDPSTCWGPAGATTCEAKHRGIKREHWAQCARVSSEANNFSECLAPRIN